MYTPPLFRVEDKAEVHALMRAARSATLVTATAEGLVGTPLPVLLDAGEGELGTIYAHVARANPQWKLSPTGEALAIFSGPEAYITPSWYATKAETHKVVPTWNFVAVHAWGTPVIQDDPAWLRAQLDALTDSQERARAQPWRVADAPADFIAAQMRAIVGVEIPIARIEGKWKVSQNRTLADRRGVAEGLAAENGDAVMAGLVARRGGLE